MKISWIKYESDQKSFEWVKSLGGKVYELKEPEQVDSMIKELYEKEACHTIVLSNELASFSQDIIKKYQTDRSIKIIIAPIL